MKKIYFLLCAAWVVFAAGCASTPPGERNPELERRLPKIKRVLLIPAEMNIQEVGMLADQKFLSEQSKAASNALTRILTTSLAGMGYEVEILNPDKKEISQDTDMAADLSLIENKFRSFSKGAESEHIKKGPADISAVTLGTEVNPFADLYHVDALIFIQAAGFIKSNEEVKQDIYKSVRTELRTFGNIRDTLGIMGNTYNSGHLHVGLVDADTGKVLWHGFNDQGTKYDATNIQSLTEMVEYTMKNFPPAAGGGENVISTGRMEKINGKKTMVV